MFVLADKAAKYSVKNVSDLKKLKGVTSSLWVKDRAQFTLWTFNTNPNFEVTLNGLTMAPIPDVKIYLHGERSLAVSRAATNGSEVFEALNKGIEAMRSNGTLARAWRESGFINKRTETWTALN